MSSIPSDTLSVRPAEAEDAVTIVAHRRAMFFDMGYRDTAWLDEMAAAFLPWLRRALQAGDYLGWFAMTADGSVAAGAGLWLLDWFPVRSGPLRRGYILNVYTESPYRRRGLARRLVEVALETCRSQGVRTVVLHASDEGRPLYESLGFHQTNEMRLELPLD